jgi:hypothetical protein
MSRDKRFRSEQEMTILVSKPLVSCSDNYDVAGKSRR